MDSRKMATELAAAPARTPGTKSIDWIDTALRFVVLDVVTFGALSASEHLMSKP
jgi:hypothetical protein